jgi:RNA polymerase sigma-70 factor
MAGLLMQERTAVYGYILACVRDHHDTEDLLQEVSVAVIESASQLRDAAGFLPWAREIARRRVLAHLRRRGRERPCDPELALCLAEAADRLERRRPSASACEALRACLERLPLDARDVLLGRYADPHAEVGALASSLGRSVQSVYATIKRAKGALRKCVERRLAREV